ncbi:MAG TPA: serine/threonine-protein kinase [Vicinamibacterales bacterium]|jgi:serine/threonine-protein kinase
MSGHSDDLGQLLELIADGGSVDWDELERAATNEATRARIRQLRLIAEVAEVHRSHIDDVTLAEDDIVTDRATTPIGGWPADRPIGVPRSPAEGTPATRENVWGHLLLVRKIGEGAFGEVFQAHDTWLDHPVALKLLKREIEDRVSPSLILHEARKLARVRHSNVVTVHGADRHDGRVGFWMDFIDGDTLAARVAKGRLSPGEAVYVGQEVCKALSAVHQAKLIHRDVKAQNVMRASDGGRIILMDFGAGELVNDTSLGGRQHGTPLYLAPELLRGGDASVQSDIYAVGVLLYHLVSGRYPVEAASPSAILDAHDQGLRRRLRDERSDLPRSFIEIVERAVHPDPAQRFVSAGEMEDKLSGEPSSPLPRPSRDVRPDRLTTRQYVGRGATFVVGLVALTGALGFITARFFDRILHVDSEFSRGLVDAFVLGSHGVFPIVFYWLIGAAAIGVISALRLLPVKLIPTMWNRFVALADSWDPAATAAAVVLAGAGSWIVVNFFIFASLFDALFALEADPSTSMDLSILGTAGIELHTRHFLVSTYLSMLMALAAWRLFPRLEQRAASPPTVRVWRWGAVAVAFLLVATSTAPRGINWELYPVVTFDGRSGLVIGTTNDDLLVYSPDEPGRPHTRVRKDAKDLHQTGEARLLFDGQRRR